jgi:hypothetical protein
MRNNQNRLGPTAAPPQTAAPALTGLDFVVPTEFVALPSRGKFYATDHPLHNQETIEIKFMTAKEEDLLTSTTLIEKGLVIDRLLESIIVLDVDPSSLLVGDRNAIMIAARASGYGHDYKTHLACTECGHEQDYDFDLKKTNMKEECFDQDYLSGNKIVFNNETGCFDVLLPKSDVTVGIRMLTGKDELTGDDGNNDNVITNLLSRFIATVNGNGSNPLVSQFIENMLAADSRYLRTVLVNLTPNIDLKQEFVCEKCGVSKDREVPLTAEFFWPQ